MGGGNEKLLRFVKCNKWLKKFLSNLNIFQTKKTQNIILNILKSVFSKNLWLFTNAKIIIAINQIFYKN